MAATRLAAVVSSVVARGSAAGGARGRAQHQLYIVPGVGWALGGRLIARPACLPAFLLLPLILLALVCLLACSALAAAGVVVWVLWGLAGPPVFSAVFPWALACLSGPVCLYPKCTAPATSGVHVT
jgi:hypothetical protein